MSDFDGLRICVRCGAYETTNTDSICSHCKEQDAIDDEVFTPDMSHWDMDDDPATLVCAYCGRGGVALLHLHDTTWICPSCNDEYFGDDS